MAKKHEAAQAPKTKFFKPDTGFILTFLIVPAVFSYSSMDPWNGPRFIAIALFICIVFSIALFKKKTIQKINPAFTWAIAFWIGWTLLSMIHTINIGDAMYVVGIRILFIGFLLWVLTIKNAESIIPYIVLLGVVESIIGISELTGWMSMNTIADPPTGTTGNPNFFGSFMMLILPLSISWMDSESLKRNVWKIIAPGIIIIAALLSKSTATFLSLAVMGTIFPTLIIFSKWSRRFTEAREVKSAVLMCAIPVMLIVAPIAWSLMNFDKTERVDKNITSITERALVWRKTVEISKESPFLGVGPAGFKYRILGKGLTGLTTQYAVRYFPQPHNDFLWLLCDSGFPAMLAYAAMIVILFYLALRRGFLSDNPQKKRKMFLLASGLAGWIIISGVSFPLERIDHLVIFSVYCAWILKESASKDFVKFGRTVPLYLLAITSAALLFFFGIDRFNRDEALLKMLDAKEKGYWEEVIIESEKAQSSLYSTEYFSSTPLAWYKGVANFQLKNYDTALKAFREAYKVNPWHPHVLNNLGSAFVMTGQTDSAIVYYKKTIGYFPDFPEPYINLSKVYSGILDTAAAIHILEQYPPAENHRYKEIIKELEKWK